MMIIFSVILVLGLKTKIFGLGLASCGLGLDVAGLVNITDSFILQ
jgi:hypothetical protein